MADAFGRGVLVVLGWHVLLGAAFVVYLQTLSDTYPDECAGIGCSSPRGTATMIGVTFILPAIVASSFVAVPVTALVARKVHSGLAAGTIAAFSIWLVAGAVLCALAQS
ncbi:hypothetical protein ACQP00_22445 [Dactylosporangium sp. CS-047395]|uniref:hypothetical protein n=1 Tax=Dactylosporangium sp. CS-047395 TaxID=3239936 RepID=UPI003D929197